MSLRFFCAANVVTASVAARAFSSHRRSETTKECSEDKIKHLTKVWNPNHFFEQIGWE